MIKLYDFDSLKPEEILNRDIRAEKNVEDVVDAILADVRTRGDEALKEYALKFDGAEIENLQVTQEEIEDAFANMDPYFLETLKEAAANIESFHRQQVHKNFVVNDKPGIVLGQKYTPIEKAGVYVPGGTAAYPSTVLMDVIPAKVAGVSEIVMTTPAGKDGKVNPVILAAAATAGVTKIFKTGGAQAVAALAYGTRTIPAVDKIVGPGNIYVATAKRKVFGKVGIDMIAGPNHTLPTSGTARFSSPLGVDDFVKKSSFLYYTREALGEVAPRIADFAEREGLHAHARSVTIRYEK